ncbi:MAG: MerR family transcriptional regulator, partial [Clostridia bacterium]|nr:MerR family transcriptional regulator [Clostridia bacterium]
MKENVDVFLGSESYLKDEKTPIISDAAKMIDVEPHVLRYWEEELEMVSPRNEMGHRYYTDVHIRIFRQVKELKEKGYQLKAIQTALAKSLETGEEVVCPMDALEEDVVTAVKECVEKEQDKVEQLRNLMV